MRIFKNPVFMFILGGIIFFSIGVYAEYIVTADKIEYSANVSVKDKIDDLYTRVKPLYTGSTTVTPSYNTQTLNTNNKILSSNITINPIPSSLVDVSASTITSSSDIISGKKAYKADGTLINGSHNEECVKGTHVWTQSDSDNGYKIVNFKPSFFSLSAADNNNTRIFWYYNYSVNSTQYYAMNPTNPDSPIRAINLAGQTSFTIGSNYLQLKWNASAWNGHTIYYTICR